MGNSAPVCSAQMLRIVLQHFVARELSQLTRNKEIEEQLPGFRLLLWVFHYNACVAMLAR